MRIISGAYKGRRITPPGNLPVRPTTDFAREGLFNLLQTRIDLTHCKVVDLFSGTGFISYEFCSRGTPSVMAVEQDHRCVAFILKNIGLLGLDTLSVVRSDVFRYLRYSADHADLVFADPPYDLGQLEELPAMVMGSGVLAPDGMFILEHGPRNRFRDFPPFSEEHHYGKVHFSFFRKP